MGWNALNAARKKFTKNFPCSPNPLLARQRRPRLLADTHPAGVAAEACVRATDPSGLSFTLSPPDSRSILAGNSQEREHHVPRRAGQRI